MYALFLETEAAKQIDRYVVAHGGDGDAIKLKCYINAQAYKLKREKDKSQQAWDNWWVSRCLNGDSHTEQSIDSLMVWADTPEGHEYWYNIYNL
jgi:hypothetical protein